MTFPTVSPSTASMVGLQSMNAAGSLSYGNDLGDAIAQLVAWYLAVRCNCAPPPEAIKAVHYICVVSVVIAAIMLQHKFIKNLPS